MRRQYAFQGQCYLNQSTILPLPASEERSIHNTYSQETGRRLDAAGVRRAADDTKSTCRTARAGPWRFAAAGHFVNRLGDAVLKSNIP